MGKEMRNKIFFAIVLLIFSNCICFNEQECGGKMNKPKNVLFISGDNEKIIYVIDIRKSNLDAFDGNEIIEYTIIEGDYPKHYNRIDFILRIIPDDGKLKFETMLRLFSIFEKNKYTGHLDPDTGWMFSGYSTDDSLQAKVFGYYKEHFQQEK